MYRLVRVPKAVTFLFFAFVMVTALVHAYPTLPMDALQDVYAQQGEEKVIYLTFDDGPSSNTAAILDVLREEGAKATFFVIGKDGEEEQALMRRVLEEGHTLGLHCYAHDYNVLYRSLDSYLADFEAIENLMLDATGVQPEIFRFPGGSANREAPQAVLREIVEETAARGYMHYDWHVVSGDDTAVVYAPETLFENVKRGIEERDEAVILFHDAALYTTTPEAVRMVIRYYRGLGYTFERLTPEVEPVQFTKPRQATGVGT